MCDMIADGVDTGEAGVLPPGSDLRRPWSAAFELEDEVGPAGRLLAARPGGPDLVEALGELEGWACDVGSVVEVVAAYERVASWARAGAAAAAARLAERPEVNPSWPREVGRPTEPNGASTELSLRLGVSRRAASTLVGMGRALRTVHHGTGEALAAGHVDWPKARVIVDSLEHVAPVVALEVEDRVLPTAAGRTATQLRREIARLLEEIDPEDAADRYEHARTRRCVTRPRALPDGMASMTATLTVEAAVRLDACLQAAAEAAHSDGDARTVDQLRADALDAMGRVAWSAGFIGMPSVPTMDRGGGGRAGRPGGATDDAGGPAEEGRPSGAFGAALDGGDGTPTMSLTRRGGPATRVHVTVGYGTLLGLDDRPGELAGYGPVSADVARRLAMDGTWRRLLVDEPSGTVLDVGTTRYVPPADMLELVRERNRTCVIPTCGVPARRCQTDHTVPFPRAGGRPAGEGHAPEVQGSEAQEAHALESERPALESERPALESERPALQSEGHVLDRHASEDVGRPRGRRAPVGPGGRGSAPQGRTAADNLGPLCATHHLFKTHGGFRLAQPRPGSFVVRTPSGHVYLQAPDRPPGLPGAPPGVLTYGSQAPGPAPPPAQAPGGPASRLGTPSPPPDPGPPPF